MKTAVEAFESVQVTAGAIKNADLRVVGAMGDYDIIRQGDVYVWKLPGIPKGCSLIDKPSPQIAPGTTQGSRHIIAEPGKVTQYVRKGANAIQGPVIDAPEGFTLEHPEHAHVKFEPGVYAITFQRQRAEELRRTQD